jgi:putative GTP pyrophosphokinase
MSEADFLFRWAAEKAAYAAWGKYVRRRILDVLGTRVDVGLDLFLKICPEPRVKFDSSLLDKAFHRGKNYTNPYDQITDKVGLRFVVLLLEDVDLLCNIVENCPDWTALKDQDPAANWAARPSEFGYVSVHYIATAAREIQIDDIRVPVGMPCEVQIRTLLQHAHCELTHDTLYKPKIRGTAAVKRAIAKATALIEATDDYFTVAMRSLREAAGPQQQALVALGEQYTHLTTRPASYDAVNLLLLDAYGELVGGTPNESVAEFFRNRDALLTEVAEKARHSHLFRQATILLMYTLTSNQPRATKENWPLELESLRPIYVDLGLAFDHF